MNWTHLRFQIVLDVFILIAPIQTRMLLVTWHSVISIITVAAVFMDMVTGYLTIPTVGVISNLLIMHCAVAMHLVVIVGVVIVLVSSHVAMVNGLHVIIVVSWKFHFILFITFKSENWIFFFYFFYHISYVKNIVICIKGTVLTFDNYPNILALITLCCGIFRICLDFCIYIYIHLDICIITLMTLL